MASMKKPVAKVRLNHEDVMVAAEALVDRRGLDELTMTSLAGELGVKVPSLYNHVDNLDALRAEVQVRAMADIAAEVRTSAMGRVDEAGLRVLVGVYRDYAHRHPRRYELLTRAPLDRDRFLAAATGANEALLSMVRSAGVAEADAMEVELAVFSAVHGFVSLEVSGFFGDEFDLDAVFDRVLDGAVELMHSART